MGQYGKLQYTLSIHLCFMCFLDNAHVRFNNFTFFRDLAGSLDFSRSTNVTQNISFGSLLYYNLQHFKRFPEFEKDLQDGTVYRVAKLGKFTKTHQPSVSC